LQKSLRDHAVALGIVADDGEASSHAGAYAPDGPADLAAFRRRKRGAA
jgi:hypothetical protein